MAVTRYLPDGASGVRRTNPPATVAAIMRAQGATTGEANRFANMPGAPTMAQLQRSAGATTGEAQRFANIAAQASARKKIATPVQATPGPSGPVNTAPIINEQPITSQPVGEPTIVEGAFEPAPAAPVEATPAPYSVYDDPVYQQLLAQAQSAFNLDRINALANMQYEQRPIQRTLEMRPQQAEAERRRLAGNFAARGMAGGRAGVLTRAEAEVNAREIGARTGLREQIAELNRQFTANFGAEGADWLGTRRGFEAQQAAIQQALQNRLAGLTTVG